ncbi:MAG: ComEC/Rec2 family competence protein [Elainellaceae cyanobacterium]
MNAAGGVMLCLAYGLGLLLTGVSVQVWGVSAGAIALPGMGLLAGAIAPRVWRTGPPAKTWIAAGLVGLLAALYFQVRLPRPADNDISTLLANPANPAERSALTVTAHGFIDTPPRETRSGKLQFELAPFQVQQMDEADQPIRAEAVSGRLYVTLPLKLKDGLHPGQMLTVKGVLYQPKPASNPGGFDFQQYLSQRGIFAGLTGKTVSFPATEGRFREQWTWRRSLSSRLQQTLWQVRQRIVRSQAAGLAVKNQEGKPDERPGALVSAMLLGKGGVDVPFDLRDSFANAGLAHALAASGFQVSLLIGIMLSLTRSFPSQASFALSATVLLGYVGLTGLEPSVARAGVMGFAVLAAITLGRRVNPLNSLLLAATLLLLVNPVWIWDLGFQLSVLATLGLLVTAPVLTKWLDWLPSAIAPLVAVPLAAFAWTIPLQLHVFGVVSPYSLPLNILTSPLITGISLGSGASGLAALAVPAAGSAIAHLLLWPTRFLIALVDGANQLPGSAFAAGAIAPTQVVALYGIYLLVWGVAALHRRWWVAAVMCIGLVAVPAGAAVMSRLAVTVLDTTDEPMLIVQNRSRVGLIGNLSPQDVQFTVLPFLRQQGVNRVNWAIAPDLARCRTEGWMRLSQQMPIQAFYFSAGSCNPPETADQPTTQQLIQQLQTRGSRIHSLPLDQAVQLGDAAVRTVSQDPLALRFQVDDQIWLLLRGARTDRLAPLLPRLATLTSVLWWDGAGLDAQILGTIRPQQAIATRPLRPAEAQGWLSAQNVPLHIIDQQGAIQWTPKTGFRAIAPVD